MRFKLLISMVAVLVLPSLAWSEIIINDFQGGTTQGWVHGGSSTMPPVQFPDGGPSGSGDGYLSIASDGDGAAGKLLAFNNSSPWRGDYAAQGIERIELDLRNYGDTSLQIRVVLQGSGGSFISTDSVNLPTGGGWIHGVISLDSAKMVGGGNFNSTITNVTSIRVFHNPFTTSFGPEIVASIGVDNITAAGAEVPEPAAVVHFLIGLVAIGFRRGGLVRRF